MEFPSKPWSIVLDEPIPCWATHNIDFTNLVGDSYSVWVGKELYKYYRETGEDAVDGETGYMGDWDVARWKQEISHYPYVKITDLQPIEENE